MRRYFNHNPKLLLIAEIGGNHEGDFNEAKRLTELALASEADAIKFQIYRGDLLVSSIESPERNIHFKKFELLNSQFVELAKLITNSNKLFMASLWDMQAIKEFDPYISIHKVGSGDLTNYPLLELIAQTNKPLILSTAMANLDEIKDTISFLDTVNPKLRTESKLCVMHCVAMYGNPADSFANLASIRVLQEAFPDIHIGYSDHTVGMYACELAVSMGARVIEKHFTDNKTRDFRDHHISANQNDFRQFRNVANKIDKLLGDYQKEPIATIETTERIREFRRAIYLSKDCKMGTVLSQENMTTLRPNVGIDAKNYYTLIGKKLKKDRKAFESLSYEDFE
jgi:N-acetylneuraminate synthase/N,N'-diacetyllegionaminate synthase